MEGNWIPLHRNTTDLKSISQVLKIRMAILVVQRYVQTEFRAERSLGCAVSEISNVGKKITVDNIVLNEASKCVV